MPEKLIQRATAQGARFTSVHRPDGRALVVECDAASARVLLALCRRFNVPAKVTGRRGVSALRRFARRRMTLPLGLALAVALCAFFLGHIWIVDIAFSGERAALGDAGRIRRALEAMDIRPGTLRDLDPALIAQTLQAETGEYSYIGVHPQGVRLLVEAVPEIPAPGVYDVEAARDLVCDRDGIVVSAIARSGELCVAPGDAVRRGQLLIRGEELSGKDETRSIAALGEVIIRSWYEGEATLPLSATIIEDSGRYSTKSSLVALDRKWTITEGATYPNQRAERECLPIGGLFIPIELWRETFYETRERREPVDVDALKPRLEALAIADARLTLLREGPEALGPQRCWVDYENNGATLHARAVCEIQADAAVTREALQGG